MRLYPRTRLLFDSAPNMAAINFALPSYQFPACIRLERRQFLSRQTFFSPMFPPELSCFYSLSSFDFSIGISYRYGRGGGGGGGGMKMNFGRVFVNIDNWACMANIGNRVNRLHSLIFCFQYLSFFSFFKFVVWLINNCK